MSKLLSCYLLFKNQVLSFQCAYTINAVIWKTPVSLSCQEWSENRLCLFLSRSDDMYKQLFFSIYRPGLLFSQTVGRNMERGQTAGHTTSFPPLSLLLRGKASATFQRITNQRTASSHSGFSHLSLLSIYLLTHSGRNVGVAVDNNLYVHCLTFGVQAGRQKKKTNTDFSQCQTAACCVPSVPDFSFWYTIVQLLLCPLLLSSASHLIARADMTHGLPACLANVRGQSRPSQTSVPSSYSLRRGTTLPLLSDTCRLIIQTTIFSTC